MIFTTVKNDTEGIPFISIDFFDYILSTFFMITTTQSVSLKNSCLPRTLLATITL